jgi:hypothetical protein
VYRVVANRRIKLKSADIHSVKSQINRHQKLMQIAGDRIRRLHGMNDKVMWWRCSFLVQMILLPLFL